MFRVAPATGIEKDGSHLPAQGAQDADEQGEDNGGDGENALRVEAFGIQRLLRQSHISKR